MWRAVAILALAGCAQIFGLEDRTRSSPDARAPDARSIDAPPPAIDAQLCVGGDARVVDPATGACYMFFASPMTRNAARTVCTGVGAQLASIQSANESTLIVGL